VRHTHFPILKNLGPAPVSAIGDSIIYALNNSTEVLNLTESTIALDTVVLSDTATYSVSGGVITVLATGTYLIMNHLAVDRDTAGGNRTSGESFLHINGTLVSGCYTDGYLRRNSGDDEWSDTGFGIYELTANDTVELRKLRINANGANGRVVGNVTSFTPAKTALQMIRLDENAETLILEGAVGDTSALSVNDTDTDQTWTTELRKDANYTHAASSADVAIIASGTYLVCYSNSWLRATDNSTRTGVYERLEVNGVDLAGSWANNYIRGSQSGESILRGNNSICMLVRTSSPSEILKLISAREAGGIVNNRLPLKSRLAIYELDSVDTFKIGSASTQSVGGSSAVTLVYDDSTSPYWIDSPYSLASDQVSVTDASRYLMLQAVTSDVGGSTRNSPFQWPRVNGSTDLYYGTGSNYSRSSGSMQRTSMSFGQILDLAASDDMEARNQSQASNATRARQISSGGFAGIDLSTL